MSVLFIHIKLRTIILDIRILQVLMYQYETRDYIIDDIIWPSVIMASLIECK